MDELSKQYNPKEVEDKWYQFWQENKLFSAAPNPDKKPFCVVIPPPNITGILHMGHALNNTIQDILIRYHRMLSFESLWMPGTDHAGIATQNVVEKAIARENLKRQDLGRNKFLERVWAWQKEYGSTILKQLKKLGASCDWSRTRFTMDEEYSKTVIEVFCQLYEKGLIYQGNYIINWCPRCQTALSDEECSHKEINGFLYYIKYPLKTNDERRKTNDEYITVATTRPETMLGDTAVAINPKDKRYKKFVGKTLILPLLNREIKIIADSIVDMKFGTGAVKVTPAHDPNDYILGKKHRLDFINVMASDGKLNENAGDYKDMDRFEAREVILEDLKQKRLLGKIEPHKLSAGHCYRCHTIVEPYLSKQWFLSLKPLAKEAIQAVKKGKIKFHPKRWTKVYLNWMNNIQDWCISRQIWWGHRLPVYYCKVCMQQANESIVNSQESIEKIKTINYKLSTINNKGVIVSRLKPEKCPLCGSSDICQDEDVLDTWFSSWLWPFATFYWPFSSTVDRRPSSDTEYGIRNTEYDIQRKADLDFFYPTSVLVTAPEIIFFWVARMIMAGLYFMKDIPFRDVYIHGTVRDIEGKKMSKSLGNIIDPLDIIDEYGTDALRFSLISITAQGQDVYLSKERFEQGRNFANKIWNASRFVLMNLDKERVKTDLCVFFKKEDLDLVNRWILSRFYSTLKEINKLLDNFKFNEAINLLYSFFWHEFCDWYLEIIKSDIKNTNNQIVMYKVLEKFLRILHPFMPFITEEVWQKLYQNTRTQKHKNASIMIQNWPHTQEEIIDKKTESKINLVFEIIAKIRNMRQEIDVDPKKILNVIISSSNKNNGDLIDNLSNEIKNLAKLNTLEIKDKYTHTKSAITSIIKDIHITLPLEGIIDIEKEKQKLDSKIKVLSNQIKVKENLLSNKEFIKKADKEIIEKEKEKLKELNDILKRTHQIKNELQ